MNHALIVCVCLTNNEAGYQSTINVLRRHHHNLHESSL
jgi:hypothetical protein